jgi:hypothetical protein
MALPERVGNSLSAPVGYLNLSRRYIEAAPYSSRPHFLPEGCMESHDVAARVGAGAHLTMGSVLTGGSGLRARRHFDERRNIGTKLGLL